MPNEPRRREHRWILVVLAIGLIVTIVLTFFGGTTQTLELLANANLVFVAGIVLFQTLRYVFMTISARVVAEIVEIRAPMFPLFQAQVAATAANRTFPGGAAGLVAGVNRQRKQAEVPSLRLPNRYDA